MAYRFWTPEEEEIARAMKAGGSTYRQIGEAIGRKPHAVEQALLRMRGGFNKLGRVCSECPKPISDKNKVGKCKSCNLKAQNGEKTFTRARLSSLLQSPSMRAGTPERRRAAIKAAAKRMENPEYREWLANNMREVVGPLSRTPENLAKRDTKAAGRKLSARLLAWCPEHLRPLYREIRRKGVPCAEAKASILAEHRRAEAELSPFERQERALARGARLVANDRGSSLDSPADYGERKWERLAS
jgi:hypothetical protein